MVFPMVFHVIPVAPFHPLASNLMHVVSLLMPAHTTGIPSAVYVGKGNAGESILCEIIVL